jgi:Trk K+ transport system NAD-binding subunit
MPLPAGAVLLAVERNGRWARVEPNLEIRPGDVYLALAPVGGEAALREALSGR